MDGGLGFDVVNSASYQTEKIRTKWVLIGNEQLFPNKDRYFDTVLALADGLEAMFVMDEGEDHPIKRDLALFKSEYGGLRGEFSNFEQDYFTKASGSRFHEMSIPSLSELVYDDYVSNTVLGRSVMSYGRSYITRTIYHDDFGGFSIDRMVNLEWDEAEFMPELGYSDVNFQNFENFGFRPRIATEDQFI